MEVNAQTEPSSRHVRGRFGLLSSYRGILYELTKRFNHHEVCTVCRVWVRSRNLSWRRRCSLLSAVGLRRMQTPTSRECHCIYMIHQICSVDSAIRTRRRTLTQTMQTRCQLPQQYSANIYSPTSLL